MTEAALPALARAADPYVIAERVNVLIRDYNSGRIADLEALLALHDDDATVFLGANVALNNTANFFNGPNTGSVGASGQKWLISALAVVNDTGGTAGFTIQIHDGTNAIAGSIARVGAANQQTSGMCQRVVILTAATTFTLQVRDFTTTTGVLLTTAQNGPANLATSITVVRLA